MTYDRKSVKQRARWAMVQARPRTWVVTLVLVALVALLPALLQMLIPGKLDWLRLSLEMVEHPELEERLAMRMMSALATYVSLTLLVGVVFTLLRIVVEYGYRGYALRVYRGEKADVGTLFGGFSRLGTVLGSAAMVGIFWYLWMMLMVVISLAVGVVIGLLEGYISGPVRTLALTVLVALDVVWGVWVSCRYALTPYFVMSRPHMGALDAITASKKAMKGNKLRRVALSLSFLGWRLLLGLIAAVVGAVGGMLALLCVSERLFWLAERIAQGLADGATIVDFYESMLLPLLLVGVVTVLVCLPLKLWLMGYETVTCAGFFQEIVGDAPDRDVPAFGGAPAATPVGAPAVERAPVTVAAPAGGSGERPYDPFGGDAADPRPPRQEQP